MINEPIPTKEDWECLPTDDLDAQAVFRDFYGKTNAEMQTAFSRFVIEMADSLRWMPPKPFCYYMQGFADFVMSGKFHEMDAADVASTFLILVEEKLREQPKTMASLMNKLFPVVTHLVKHQNKYEADIEIYGDFSEKEKEIERLWSESAV